MYAPYVYWIVIYNSYDTEADWGLDRETDKEDVAHVYSGIWHSQKKGWAHAISENMVDLEVLC